MCGVQGMGEGVEREMRYCFNKAQGAGELAQSVSAWLHKCEDHSFALQHPHKQPVQLQGCGLSTGEPETRGSLGHVTNRLALPARKFQISQWQTSQKNEVRNDLGDTCCCWPLASTCMHICTHPSNTHIHIRKGKKAKGGYRKNDGAVRRVQAEGWGAFFFLPYFKKLRLGLTK